MSINACSSGAAKLDLTVVIYVVEQMLLPSKKICRDLGYSQL